MMTCDDHEMLKTSLVWWTDAEDRARLDSYCIQDVRTERALFDALPPLSEAEREAWLRDQVANDHSPWLGDLFSQLTTDVEESPAEITDSKLQSSPEIVCDWIRAHVSLVHILAQPLAGEGKVVITSFGENPDEIDPKTGKPGKHLRPKVFHAAIGDVKASLEGVAQVVKWAHYNVYMSLAVFRPDLASWAKGFERDVVASLGIVLDFDDANAGQWAERVPLRRITSSRAAPIDIK